MNNRVWILGTVIASLAVIALGVTIGILPKIAETTTNTLALSSAQAQNAAYQAELEALKTQFENIDEVRQKLADLQESLPSSGDYPGFIAQIAQLAESTGVQVLGTTQTAPIVYGAADAAGADTGTAATPISGGTLLAIPYTVTVNATDPVSVFSFMDGLRLGDRLLLITSYEYEAFSMNDVPVYQVTISLYIYTLVDPGALQSPTDGSVPTDPVEAEPTPSATPTDGATPTPTDTPVTTP